MADLITTVVEVEGDENLLLAFDRIEAWPRRQGQDFLDWLTSNAAFWIRIYAPQGETGALIRHVNRTAVGWHPGGAGGGGTYEAMAGVRGIDTAGSRRIYPTWVEKGTANQGRGYIYPRGDASRLPAKTSAADLRRKRWGKVLTFQKQGEPRKYRYRVRGQRPQPFVFAAFHQVSIYTRARMLTLGREIVRRG